MLQFGGLGLDGSIEISVRAIPCQINHFWHFLGRPISDFACQFTSMREATVSNFRKIGEVFFELQPSEKLGFDPENRA